MTTAPITSLEAYEVEKALKARLPNQHQLHLATWLLYQHVMGLHWVDDEVFAERAKEAGMIRPGGIIGVLKRSRIIQHDDEHGVRLLWAMPQWLMDDPRPDSDFD